MTVCCIDYDVITDCTEQLSVLISVSIKMQVSAAMVKPVCVCLGTRGAFYVTHAALTVYPTQLLGFEEDAFHFTAASAVHRRRSSTQVRPNVGVPQHQGPVRQSSDSSSQQTSYDCTVVL